MSEKISETRYVHKKMKEKQILHDAYLEPDFLRKGMKTCGCESDKEARRVYDKDNYRKVRITCEVDVEFLD